MESLIAVSTQVCTIIISMIDSEIGLHGAPAAHGSEEIRHVVYHRSGRTIL